MSQNKSLKLFKDYSTVIFGVGLGRGLSLLASLILARALGVENFGIFSLFFTVMTLIWQLPISIDSTYVRYVKAESEENKISYLRTSFLIKILIFLSLLILAFPLGFLLSYYVFGKPELVFYISIAVISGAFLSVFSSISGLYQGEEDFFRFSLVNLLFYLAVILVIVPMFFFKLGLTLNAAISVNFFVAALAGFLGYFWIFRRIKSFSPVHFSLFADMLHFGKWLLASNFTYIILQRLDILVLAKYVDFASIGIYSAAVRVAMLASLFTGNISSILMPRGSQALKSRQHL
ncbi:MAG: oligosaccharide flippase family protein [Candidatus Omnitrophota bacterium]|jgi:O-antigen/teichoic acid export membrane protein